MASSVHLLTDQPTTQDVFGTHNRVATAIAELIANEKPGRAIAVVGPWGSGKSSVVQMVQAHLVNVADVFIFDAWTHEGDPLRRTFLESLINWLWPKDVPGEIHSLRKEISLRKKTKEETTAPVLTWEARVLGVLLLAVPAGLAMFAAMVRVKQASPWLIVTALVVAMLPPLFVIVHGLGTGLRWAVSRLSKTTVIGLTVVCMVLLTAAGLLYSSWIAHYIFPQLVILVSVVLLIVIVAIFRSSAPGVLPLLLNRTVTTTRSESIDSAEPSSIDFQRWFQSIVTAHSRSRGIPLVIAIDNLDRIESGLARQLWTTMRIFFEFTSDQRDKVLNERRIWLLAAFDKEAIRSLYVNDADSFISKTFQTAFSVPSLVVIHRDDFLKKQLAAAFPFCGEGLLSPVVRLYALKHASEISTPRRIINFVNSLGSIHRQWRLDEVPLVNQAQYVLAAENGTDIMSILASAATTAWSPEELVGTKWQEFLAAIHFNAPPKDVAHVFMPPAIIDGLMSGDVTKFAPLAKIRGFGDILFEVMMNNREAWKQPQSVVNAVSALNSLPESGNDEGVNGAWRLLAAAASRIEKWDPSPQTGTALATLINRSADKNDQIAMLLESAGRAIPRTQPGAVDNSEEALSRYALAISPVIDLLMALPPSFQMEIYGSAATYLTLLSVFYTLNRSRFIEIGRRLDTDARDRIPEVMAEMITKVQLKEDFYPVIKMVSEHYPKMNWGPAIQAAEGILGNTSNNFLQGGFKATFEMLVVLSRSDPSAARSLENLARNGTLHHYLGVAEGPQSRDLGLAMLLLFGNTSEPLGWPGNARQGFRIFREWLDTPDSASLGTIAQLVISFGQWPRLQSRIQHSSSISDDHVSVLRLLAERREALVDNSDAQGASLG